MLKLSNCQAREEITEFPSLAAPEPAMKPLLYDQFLEIFKQEQSMPRALSDYPHESFGNESFIFNADSMDLLKLLPSNSVDSIITDPPYHVRESSARNSKSKKGILGLEWDGGDIAFKPEIWKECLRVLKPGGHLMAFGFSRNFHHLTMAIEQSGFEIRDHMMWIYSSGMPRSYNVSKSVQKAIQKNVNGITEQNWGSKIINSSITPIEFVEKFEGYGTKLKGAHEPIVIARKPLSEPTLVENILKWGVGVININKCRVEVIDKQEFEFNTRGNERSRLSDGELTNNMKGGYKQDSTPKEVPKGRWPANLIISDDFNEDLNKFFYCSKPNKKERNKGLEGAKLSPKALESNNLSTYNTRCTKCNKKIFALEKYKCKCDTPIKSNAIQENENFHPTVKPEITLSYLIDLITPPGGTILDPFAGSSSLPLTIIEKDEEFKFIAIEKNEDYYNLSVKRCKCIFNKINSSKPKQK